MVPTRESGVSLVDVCIAVAIVVIICGVAYPGFITANDTMVVSGQKTRLEGSTDRIFKAIVSEMRTGQLAAVSPPGQAPWIDVHPPQTGIALDKIDSDGTVPWNAAETHRLGFRETRRLKESDVGEDLNRDGDRNDEFALGVIELTTSSGTRPVAQRGRVMLGLPGYQQDLNGDGTADPLFSVEDRRVTIRLFLVQQDDKSNWHRAELTRSLYLRNVQE